MKLLRRHVTISTLPSRVTGFAKAIINILFTFTQPLKVIIHYVRSTVPEQGYADLLNGYRITFSGHRHDLISTIIVFCKQDYGKVKPGSICLDIGANIGLFALYAVSQGAEKVLAFEANRNTYECMVRNISQNRLSDRIQPYNLAVTGRSGERVAFPSAPSPYNRIQSKVSDGTIDVETICLEDILKMTPNQHADVLQMDIEGAEYAVFAKVENDTLDAIDEIRMEYHAGPLNDLRERLQQAGFRVVKHKAEQQASGIIWFRKVQGRVQNPLMKKRRKQRITVTKAVTLFTCLLFLHLLD